MMRSKIREFLTEDIGPGDITSELVIPVGARARGRMICKEACVLAGAGEAREVFEELGLTTVLRERDGARLREGDIVMEVSGSARSMLSGERLALNFVMRMSGIATLTRTLVDRCHKINPKVKVAATRKTTPGFRAYEKKAVEIGGGYPHRMGLYDAILVKNNHIEIAGGVGEALARARKHSRKKVEVEVGSRDEALAAVEHGADIIMLDNFDPAGALMLAGELKRIKPNVLIEVSGGIRPDNIERFAPSADIISLGWLTHSVRSIDFSMRIEKA
jgi:nicotinate-nucleotide pyrophosphorylase (carboxylating)